jgi:hypothetical protein
MDAHGFVFLVGSKALFAPHASINEHAVLRAIMLI